MKKLGLATFLIFPAVLAACPDGYGPAAPRQSDAGDATFDRTSPTDATNDVDATPPAKRTSALCGVSGRDDCGAYATCDAELGCVECADDRDCPATEARCVRGACVGCRFASDSESGDCAKPGETCWQTDHECHPRCNGGAGSCPAGATCDVLAGACVGCIDNQDCNGGTCDAVEHRCVECVDDTSCGAGKPRCRKLTHACVACTANEDCGRGAPICDPVTFTCRKGCTSDAACADGMRCEPRSATCVAKATPVDAGDGGG